MTRAKKTKSRGNLITPFMGCAQIYHRKRWYRAPFGEQVSLAWTPMRRAVRQRPAHMGELHSPPSGQRAPLPPLCTLRSDKSQSAAFICPQSLSPAIPLLFRQNVGVSHG